MSNFVHAKEYDMIMYENFQCMNKHFLINFLKMWTIGILYNALMHKIEFGRV
jgi:hypothetical protein